jgi:DNA helicase II / ATP-dependent DNA helicase PcrA
MQLSDGQAMILKTGGHLLITGGPGSGKTTASILKAGPLAVGLPLGQKVLFLSFARATVSRVVEAIEHEQRIPAEQKRRIDVETYHSLFWRILKAHGYLIGLPRKLAILTPPEEAIKLSPIRRNYSRRTLSDAEKTEKKSLEDAERIRLASEGFVCFDLFAQYVGDILCESERIRRLVAAMYPVIILDEFQDTNPDQWRVVKSMGQFSRLIALADPEQRIYDWIGADPQRLQHFTDAFRPTIIDLSTDNHRSAGTDIAMFGNDLLTGRFRQESYVGVEISLYPANPAQSLSVLVAKTYAARKRLVDADVKKWSVAILVPTKKMTRLVSDTLRSPPGGMTAIPHTATIEFHAAVLGAEVVAFLMQPERARHIEDFIALMRNYFHGKGGDTPGVGDLNEAENIQAAYDEWLSRQAIGKEMRRNSILNAMLECYRQTRSFPLVGDPDRDWRAVRQILEAGPCKRLKELAEEVRNVRLLERGTQLRQALSQEWRDTGAYTDALSIVRNAFVQEHFATTGKPELGVVVMNMHKAKGKQFDEVIIFEGRPNVVKGEIVANYDRVVRGNSAEEIDDQSRQNLRVSVTRGKRRTTILTPKNDPCVLLVGGRAN